MEASNPWNSVFRLLKKFRFLATSKMTYLPRWMRRRKRGRVEAEPEDLSFFSTVPSWWRRDDPFCKIFVSARYWEQLKRVNDAAAKPITSRIGGGWVIAQPLWIWYFLTIIRETTLLPRTGSSSFWAASLLHRLNERRSDISTGSIYS